MDVLESYFKRLCISGAADDIVALQDQIRKLKDQLADQQTNLYYSEAANLRLTMQVAEHSDLQDALLAEHSDLRDDKAALQKQLQQAQDMIGTLQEQLTATRLRSTRYEQQLLLEQNRHRPLRNQVAAAEGQIAQLQSRLTALLDPHTEEQNAQLQRQLNDLVAQHRSELKQQEWRLTYQLQTIQTQLDDITRGIVRAAPPAMVVPVHRQPDYAYQPLQTALHLAGILRVTLSLDLANLAVRTHNALKRSGIKHLNDLLTHTPHELLQRQHVGPMMLQEIEAHLCALWSQLPAQYFYRAVTHPGTDDWHMNTTWAKLGYMLSYVVGRKGAAPTTLGLADIQKPGCVGISRHVACVAIVR